MEALYEPCHVPNNGTTLNLYSKRETSSRSAWRRHGLTGLISLILLVRSLLLTTALYRPRAANWPFETYWLREDRLHFTVLLFMMKRHQTHFSASDCLGLAKYTYIVHC